MCLNAPNRLGSVTLAPVAGRARIVPGRARSEWEALMTAPRETIDRQVAAYNHRDLEQFVACYASDAKVVQPDGSLLASGHEER